ncbi:MAG: single-stranded-DNA-specific exonuclease RecJ [Candidatus Malihini olakiniferum]
MECKTILRRRPLAEGNALPATLPLLLRRLYAQRGVTRSQELDRRLSGLIDYRLLDGINDAVVLLKQALTEKRRIVVVGDFDADGATSTALAMLALRSMGGSQVTYLVPNRFEDGYGLSPAVVMQAERLGAELILTVDNGISSHAGVNSAHQRGIQVLVTDHHLPGATLPAADEIINPNLRDCAFPSKSLAGVGVAFYLMMALFVQLRDSGWFSQKGLAEPKLAELLDLVALGTVADVVPLDANNRILVSQGLSRIRAGKCRPGIRALLEVANCDAAQLAASDLGFLIGPRLNAAGRLDDMSIGVTLLLCEDIVEARIQASDLNTLNLARREIEKEMHIEAMQLYEKLEHGLEQLPLGLAMYHPKWHQGVVGILASRLKERFHRPVIAFAPASKGVLKGSGRSIPGLNLRDALESLDARYPGLMVNFGGHAMAAGLSLEEHQFDTFRERFGELVAECLNEAHLERVIWSDGELIQTEFNLVMAEMLRDAGPWGQAFPEPTFDGCFRILQQKLLKKCHLKLILKPVNGGPILDGIAFNVDTRCWPDSSILEAKLAYHLKVNKFYSKCSVQLLIQHLWPL